MDQKILDEIARQLQLLLDTFEKTHGIEISSHNDCCGCSSTSLDVSAKVGDEWIDSKVGDY